MNTDIVKKNLKLIIAALIPAAILFIPVESFGIEGLTIVEKRVIALFVFATLFWILEPIPIYATSVLIIVLELVMISDKSFILFKGENAEMFGSFMSYKDIMGTFASPIILLFLGGFFLAMAATKFRLDQTLAKTMLKPFGHNPKMVMLGLMIITAFFSMFMSNTATTAMMLSILAPVLLLFPDGDKGKTAFALSIPVAANIGGIGTPIGTPPNAIAMKYLTGDASISFGKWMAFGVPYVIVLLLFGWFLLNIFYPSKEEKIQLKIDVKASKSRSAKIVYFTFGVTILLWLTDFLHGMNSYVVAMIPVAVFSATKIITKEDLKKISWDVLWLVSGGIALGLAMEKTGLIVHLLDSIPFADFSVLAIIGGASFLALLMANFMSHTATANLLMPLMAALGTSLQSIQEVGGVATIILTVTFACSIGMVLPISTPPNALAHGTGFIQTKQMAKVGIIVGIVGLLLAFLTVYILKTVNFL
ncbi:MAG: dihydroorotate dehydrogenase [Bacteroidia bacterium]|nr:MAG: dihydroorotate dehydrogenase [Bacteroidia bacterium]